MDFISVKEAAEWMAMAVSVDGVFSDNEKWLLQRFADTFGLDFREIAARSYISGYTFEKFIVKSLCKPDGGEPLFSLVRWRGDKSVDGIFAEDDKKPDLTLRCALTRSDVEFYIECKYRQSWNSVPSFGKAQLLRYAEFSRSEKKIVLIACGFGGSPEKPANIAIAPIGDYLNRRESIECINTNKIDLQKYVFNIIWNRYNHLNLSQF